MPDLGGIGILAFGSIVDDPGAGLRAAVARRIRTETPFPVEFARSSRTRDGAPTLVPVRSGGAPVPAWLLVLGEKVTLAGARALLYRRETGRAADAGTVAAAGWIAELPGFGGLATCLYTALEANIGPPVTARALADLAVGSARGRAGAARRDGISYLRQQLRRGAQTPLTGEYLRAVLARTGARDLDQAWRRVRSGSVPDPDPAGR